LRLADKRLQGSCCRVHDRLAVVQLRKTMREDVAGAKMFLEKVTYREFGLVFSEIDHYGKLSPVACFDCRINGIPVPAAIVGNLEANDIGFELAGLRGGQAVAHVGRVLFAGATAHTGTDYIEEGEDAGLGAIDHAPLENLEIAPSRAACVDDRGDAFAWGEVVGDDALCAAVIFPVWVGAKENMGMDVDESRTDNGVAGIDDICRLSWVDVFGDAEDAPVFHRDVEGVVEGCFGIDDIAAFDEEGIRLCPCDHDETGQEKRERQLGHAARYSLVYLSRRNFCFS